MSDLNTRDIDLIIFDLGGVILNIDYALTQDAFAALGIPNVAALYSQAAQNSLFDNMEKGVISPQEFRSGLVKLIGREIEDAQLDHAWNALIQDVPAQRLEFIEKLKKKYTVCMLSNTNEIHIPHFEKVIDDSVGLKRYRACFDQIFYSSRINCRKPDAESFAHVLNAMNVEAPRALFVDDSSQHLTTAESMGIQTILVPKEGEISTLLLPLLD